MSDRLERNYRRLMVFYPAAYRRTFGDEMLGVAMSGAAPGRSRPTVRESADLIGSGIRRRFTSAGQTVSQPEWHPGLSFVNAGLIVFNATLAISAVIAMLPQTRIIGLAATAAAWVLALVATVAGWRRIAAFAAVAGLGVAMFLLVRDAHWGLVDIRSLGTAVLELVPPAAAAITGVALACGRELPVRRLRTALYMVAGGAALIAVDGFGVFVGFGAVQIMTTSVAVACVFLAAMRHRNPAVSRTVLVIATYVSVVVASFRLDRSFYQASAPLDVLRLIVVATVPVVVFVVGALLIRRHERRSSTDITATGAV